MASALQPRVAARLLVAMSGLVLLLLAGCAGIPAEALKLPPESLENRQRQTRRFDGIEEAAMLRACAGVLQDLGFSLDESQTKLGLIVASKSRSAVNAAEVTAKVILGLLVMSPLPWDSRQTIRVCIVTQPIVDGPPDSFLVRVTAQRIVWDYAKNVTAAEQVNQDAIYREFFEWLSKSVFLEGKTI